MVVLPADPFFYVWNATVMSLDIDNVMVFFKASFFLFLAVDSSIGVEFFFGCNVAQIRTVGIASCS